MPENTTANSQRNVADVANISRKDQVQVHFDGRSHPIDYLFSGVAIVAALVLNVSLGE